MKFEVQVSKVAEEHDTVLVDFISAAMYRNLYDLHNVITEKEVL